MSIIRFTSTKNMIQYHAPTGNWLDGDIREVSEAEAKRRITQHPNNFSYASAKKAEPVSKLSDKSISPKDNPKKDDKPTVSADKPKKDDKENK